MLFFVLGLVAAFIVGAILRNSIVQHFDLISAELHMRIANLEAAVKAKL
jgi:hypothetical protein